MSSRPDHAAAPFGIRNPALAGIALMLLGCFAFSLNDALGKWLVATFSVGQVLLFRSIAALLLLAPLIWRAGREVFAAAPNPGLQLLRAVLSTLEVAFFYWAVTYLPLADVMTYYLAGPVYVTALSALLLREHVGWRRWLAVLVGFGGVVIALAPSPATLSWPALIAVAGSLMFALLMIITRYLRGTADIVLITGQTSAALVCGIVLTPFAYVPPTVTDACLLGLLGLVSMLGHVLVNRSLKLAPAGVVAPYQYTLLLWALVLGFLIFGDVPSWNVIAGAAIIIGAGLFILWRERRAAATPAPVLDPGG